MKSLLIKLTILIGLTTSLTANNLTPLMKAIALNQEEQAKYIIHSGTIPTKQEIAYAMEAKFSVKLIFKMIQTAGYDLSNKFSERYENFYQYTFEQMMKDPDSMIYLIAEGVDFYKVANQEAGFIGENIEGTKRILNALLDAGYSPSFIVKSSIWRRIILAYEQCLDILLAHGLNPNETFKANKQNDQTDRTLLIHFIGVKKIVEKLIKHGADVNQAGDVNSSGMFKKPLAIALENRTNYPQNTLHNIEIIELLIANGATL